MKLRTSLILALTAALALTGCGDPEPMSDAQFMRKQQEQQLAAEREQQRIQNDYAREQLRTQQIQNQALQQGLYPQQVQQPVGTAGYPAQQVAHDDGIGLGTVMAGAAAAGAVGYVAGKNNSTATNNSYYSQPKTVQRSNSYQAAPKPVIKKPLTVSSSRQATQVRKVAPKPASRPAVKRYSSSSSTKRR